MNDYLAKQSGAIGMAYGVGTAQSNTCATPIKITAIEDANNQIDLMRQQVQLIDSEVAMFLDRAAGGAFGIPSQDKCAPAPQPSGQLPRLCSNLTDLKYMLNLLQERVVKLNQIA